MSSNDKNLYKFDDYKHARKAKTKPKTKTSTKKDSKGWKNKFFGAVQIILFLALFAFFLKQCHMLNW